MAPRASGDLSSSIDYSRLTCPKSQIPSPLPQTPISRFPYPPSKLETPMRFLLPLAFALIATQANAQAFGTWAGMKPGEFEQIAPAPDGELGRFVVTVAKPLGVPGTYQAAFDNDDGLCLISLRIGGLNQQVGSQLFETLAAELIGRYGDPDQQSEPGLIFARMWGERESYSQIAIVGIGAARPDVPFHITLSYRYRPSHECERLLHLPFDASVL